MSNVKLAVAVGAGVLGLGAAVIGGVRLYGRKKAKPRLKTLDEFMKEAAELTAKAEAEPVVKATVIPSEKLEEIVRKHADESVTSEEVQSPITEAVEPKDEVGTVTGVDGEEITSVSRMRAVVAPVFWSHFEKGIRRAEVVILTESDFDANGKLEVNRGWHRCTMGGLNGILHVTKGHVSAVFLVDGEFSGISTSGSRFGGKGLINIDHQRAKAYLNGH